MTRSAPVSAIALAGLALVGAADGRSAAWPAGAPAFAHAEKVTAQFAGGQDRCLNTTPGIVGTPGDDTIAGTPGNDVIAGLGGNDTIDGGGGDDLLCGGEGNDTLQGGDGSDALSGDGGDDSADGGAGFDVLVFLQSPAAVTADLVARTATGWGADTIVGEGIVGSRFADRLRGDGTDNLLDGWGGSDVLAGLGGVDVLDGDAGNDRLDGGAGLDLALFDFAPRRITASLRTRRASGWGRDRLPGIEMLSGSRFADVLTGNAGGNVIWGNGGPDRLLGLGGPDDLIGGAGRDRLDGGPGRDRVDGGAGRDACVGERRVRCP